MVYMFVFLKCIYVILFEYFWLCKLYASVIMVQYLHLYKEA
jgi:hypothetical protein